MTQISMDDIGIKVFPQFPEYDRDLYKKIRTISEVFDELPKYKVIFKRSVHGGYKSKVCIYLGYWHSYDGWNYAKEEVKEWKEIKWDKGKEYRFK